MENFTIRLRALLALVSHVFDPDVLALLGIPGGIVMVMVVVLDRIKTWPKCPGGSS
jgi:hypothetical protein